MRQSVDTRWRPRHVLVTLLWVCTAAYLGYHVVQGDRGLLAWLRLTSEVNETNSRLQAAIDERIYLSHEVSLLRADSLDVDLLEERVRVLLNLVHPRDIVIIDN